MGLGVEQAMGRVTDLRVALPAPPSRRFLLGAGGGGLVAISAAALSRLAAAAEREADPFPATVGPVRLPATSITLAAARMAREASPPFLYNHCLRTFVFGALLAANDRLKYDAEMILVAASLHDLGLVERYASKDLPFEMDGADAAKAFLAARGVKDARAEMVWNAIALHTSALSAHQPAQVGLVGAGAGADVFGGGLKTLKAEHVAACLAAFPRLGFKVGFQKLLVDYCHRKPRAQVGTWTDAFCRVHAPEAHYPDIDRGLAASPYTE